MRRWLWLLILPALPALYLIAALAGAILPGTYTDLRGPPQHRVGFAAGPIHYDVLLPLTPPLRNRFAFAAQAGVPIHHPDARWLIVGWGATGFYTTVGTYSDLTAQAVWRGITGDTSVLHLDVLGQIGTAPWVDWHLVSDAQLASLIATIEAEFLRDSNAMPIPLDHPGHRKTDAFFAAKSPFNLLHTCNAWLGETLRQAGLPLGAWTPTTQSVRLSLWWNAIPAPP